VRKTVRRARMGEKERVIKRARSGMTTSTESDDED
jgi:hypothetical protein